MIKIYKGMISYNSYFLKDYKRMLDKKDVTILEMGIDLAKYPILKFLYFSRQREISKGIKKLYYTKRAHLIGRRYGIEIDFDGNIGPGITLSHPYAVTINPRALIGEDFTIFKGATIGSVRSGKRAGVPRIGDRVTVGCNAFVCGGITIGNDVLIAANTFVNFDVPDNSLVIGNPGIIKWKINASEDYLLK